MAPHSFGVAMAAYRQHSAFFPLIGAVLLQQQTGVVFCNDQYAPSRFYAEHRFGFAQVFGAPDQRFDDALQELLVSNEDLASDKLRLYTPEVPTFVLSSEYRSCRSIRQRFTIDARHALSLPEGNTGNTEAVFQPIGPADAAGVQQQFGVVERFWNSNSDFLTKSLAVGAWVNGTLAGVCYAAAVSESQAEVDVFVATEYRGRGLGRQLVRRFMGSCVELGISPVWDCFTNNAASMSLALAVGFQPRGEAYIFLTVPRTSSGSV